MNIKRAIRLMICICGIVVTTTGCNRDGGLLNLLSKSSDSEQTAPKEGQAEQPSQQVQAPSEHKTDEGIIGKDLCIKYIKSFSQVDMTLSVIEQWYNDKSNYNEIKSLVEMYPSMSFARTLHSELRACNAKEIDGMPRRDFLKKVVDLYENNHKNGFGDTKLDLTKLFDEDNLKRLDQYFELVENNYGANEYLFNGIPPTDCIEQGGTIISCYSGGFVTRNWYPEDLLDYWKILNIKSELGTLTATENEIYKKVMANETKYIDYFEKASILSRVRHFGTIRLHDYYTSLPRNAAEAEIEDIKLNHITNIVDIIVQIIEYFRKENAYPLNAADFNTYKNVFKDSVQFTLLYNYIHQNLINLKMPFQRFHLWHLLDEDYRGYSKGLMRSEFEYINLPDSIQIKTIGFDRLEGTEDDEIIEIKKSDIAGIVKSFNGTQFNNQANQYLKPIQESISKLNTVYNKKQRLQSELRDIITKALNDIDQYTSIPVQNPTIYAFVDFEPGFSPSLMTALNSISVDHNNIDFVYLNYPTNNTQYARTPEEMLNSQIAYYNNLYLAQAMTILRSVPKYYDCSMQPDAVSNLYIRPFITAMKDADFSESYASFIKHNATIGLSLQAEHLKAIRNMMKESTDITENLLYDLYGNCGRLDLLSLDNLSLNLFMPVVEQEIELYTKISKKFKKNAISPGERGLILVCPGKTLNDGILVDGTGMDTVVEKNIMNAVKKCQ